MIVVLPFFPGDQQLAWKLVEWMLELDGEGGLAGHSYLLVRDSRCKGMATESLIRSGMTRLFGAEGATISVVDSWDHWPESPNRMIGDAGRFIRNLEGDEPWLWLEPDTVPIRGGWLKEIAEEYERARGDHKVFLGDRVAVDDVPVHMSGVGVYPHDVITAGAGNMLICQEIAWDVFAAREILPQFQETLLIEHAWKHGTFPNWEMVEREVDLANTVLYHSSKDGSLIDRLRELRAKTLPVAMPRLEMHDGDKAKASHGQPFPYEAAERLVVEDSKNRFSIGGFGQRASFGQPGEPDGDGLPTYDIFIKTYPPDYGWLVKCLASIQKFVRGYGKIIVVAPDDKAPVGPAETLIVEPEPLGEKNYDGYLHQQEAKLYADMKSTADFILHVDSDVVFCKPCSIWNLVNNWKVEWLYTPYEKTETPWQPITEKFMKRKVAYEFMRRAPQMIPRWLYPKLREFCYTTHGICLADYIKLQPWRDFSEFNAIGAYAFTFHHDKFQWINTEEFPTPPPVARQFRSWDGTAVYEKEIESILPAAPVLADAASDKKEPSEARESTADNRTPIGVSRGGRQKSKPKAKKKYHWTKAQRAKTRAYWTPERREEYRQRAIARHARTNSHH